MKKIKYDMKRIEHKIMFSLMKVAIEAAATVIPLSEKTKKLIS